MRPFTITGPDKRTLNLLLDIEPGRYYSDAALTHYLDNNTTPEPEVVHVLFRALRAGDCVVDAGACVGFFTIIMSKLVGPTGLVLAVEPDPRNLELLHRNLQANDCYNVSIFEQPLAAKATERRAFYPHPQENGQSSLFFMGDVEPAAPALVETTTLTEVLGDHKPRLLKLDVEGAELEALQGCDYSFPYIVAEINSTMLEAADTSIKEFVELMEQWGNTPHLLHSDGSLPSAIGSKQKIVTTRPNVNLLFTQIYRARELWPEVEI